MPTKTEVISLAAGFVGKIQVIGWKEHARNSLRGFVDIAIQPQNLILRGLMVHEKNGSRWVSFPSREWVDGRGSKHFEAIVEFADRTNGDRFRDACLIALDEYLQQQGDPA